MKWTFIIEIWGTSDEVQVEANSSVEAMVKLGEELGAMLDITLCEISGEHRAHKKEIIPVFYKPMIMVMPKEKQERLRASERVSMAIKRAAEVWNG